MTSETDSRRRLVDKIYRSNQPEQVAAAVEEAGVDFVVIGSLERRDFDPDDLDAIRSAGEIIFDENGGQVVGFATAEASAGGS